MDIDRDPAQVLLEDGVTALRRVASANGSGTILAVSPASLDIADEFLARFEHELSLADRLDRTWAAVPMELQRHEGLPILVLSDPGGLPLRGLLAETFDIERVLVTGIGISYALAQLHERLVHLDLRPENILVDSVGNTRFLGFGEARAIGQSTLKPRIQGASLPYLSPEQTGRVKRDADARADLYSLGVVLYEMLTQELPFLAADPAEWLHAHVARQPVPLRQRDRDIPEVIEAIVLKLLSKKAEERYPSAKALASDLSRCLASFRTRGSVERFDVADNDHHRRLHQSAGLVGRSLQVEKMKTAFESVRSSGAKEVVLVSGQAGVGKSSLVGSIRHYVEANGGLFAQGKFDQFAREIPYSTIVQAFRGLVRDVLVSDDRDRWQEAISAALGPSGELVVNLVPELELLIGEQSPAPDLPPQEARTRFQVIFSRFLSVFARPQHPLVLFVDDVQWLDPATIELIEHITLDPGVLNVLLICAFRSDEVPPGHPFDRTRGALKHAIHSLHELSVEPLEIQDLEFLLAHMLHADVFDVRTLAQIVHRKTEGNPFFVIQFLSRMEDEGLVFLDATGRWHGDEAAIDAKKITDNVAGLVASRLLRLPRALLDVVKTLSCLGSSASLDMVAAATCLPRKKINAILWEATETRILVPIEERVSFAHDRVQEAAYELIPKEERSEWHNRIGHALMTTLSPAALRDNIFQVVDQVIKGLDHVEDEEQKRDIAQLLLEAGARAKTSAAYPAAHGYYSIGLQQLGAAAWRCDYRLKFQLEVQLAEVEFLTGQQRRAEERLADLSNQATSSVDRALVVRLLSAIYVARGDQDKAVEVGRDFLRNLGLDWPRRPGESYLRSEVAAMKELLAGRSVESLVDLPRMHDPDWLAAMDVLASMVLPALLTDAFLEELIYVQMVNLSLRHGNCDASCYAYSSIIVLTGLRLGDYDTGRRFGDLALTLVDQHGFISFRPRVYTCYSCYVVPWAQPFPRSISLIRSAIGEASASGDLVFAAAAAKTLVSNLLVSGAPLDLVEAEALEFLAVSKKANFGLAADSAVGQILLARELRGRSSGLPGDESGVPSKGQYYKYLQEGGPTLTIALAWYWIQQLQLRYVYGDYDLAIEAGEQAASLVAATRSFVDHAEYHFYAGLTHAAIAGHSTEENRKSHRDHAAEHKAKIDVWASSCPDTFSCRSELLEAEVALLDGNTMEALRLYERVLQDSRKQGFCHLEALAAERAAQVCLDAQIGLPGDGYLRLASSCYARWGANGKVRQLEARIQHTSAIQHPGTRVSRSLEDLDLMAVLEMSRAVSSEIVLDRLVKRLMVMVTEHSGATRGVLLLAGDNGMKIVAEAVTDIVNGIDVRLSGFREEMPYEIVSHVAQERSVVIIDDAQQSALFRDDRYVVDAGRTSMLCLPLEKQAKLVGVLYLENALATHLFTPDQVSVLQLLASQATVSLENASLYREAHDIEQRARLTAEELRLAYDMIPALAWNSSPDGTLIGFNKRWHDFTGLTLSESLDSGWTRSIHPEDVGKVVAKWNEVLSTGEAGEIEARMLRFDGASRSFLIRATPMRDGSGRIIKWYGTNIDIDDLKRVEEAQEMLSRAGRLAALGELTASIAHEVNQPLMAIVMNAATCLRWLSPDQLDVDEARQAAERIIRDGHRAGDVISSIRALAKNAPLAVEKIDIASVIDSVVLLTHSEVQRQGVSLEKDLDPRVSLAVGDKIQVQQVLLNLILNAVEALAGIKRDSRRIWVRTELQHDDKISISIADSGPGVSEPDKIFDAFFTSKPAGLGMGLSICRSIVEAHGGRLRVGPNEPTGSVFTFTLRAG